MLLIELFTSMAVSVAAKELDMGVSISNTDSGVTNKIVLGLYFILYFNLIPPNLIAFMRFYRL